MSQATPALSTADIVSQPPSHAAANREDRSLELEVLRQFRMVFATVRRHFSHVEKVCGISGSLLWALSVVAERDGLRVTQLAAALAIHQSTASNMVEQLTQRDLVQRVRDHADGRVVQLKITPQGQALLARAPQPARGMLAHALSLLSPDQLRCLHTDMARVIAGMQPSEEDAAVPLTDA